MHYSHVYTIPWFLWNNFDVPSFDLSIDEQIFKLIQILRLFIMLYLNFLNHVVMLYLLMVQCLLIMLQWTKFLKSTQRSWKMWTKVSKRQVMHGMNGGTFKVSIHKSLFQICLNIWTPSRSWWTCCFIYSWSWKNRWVFIPSN